MSLFILLQSHQYLWLVFVFTFFVAQVALVKAESPETNLWDLRDFASPPEVYPSPEIQSSDPHIRALFFEGATWRGQPTRVFAWMGKPETGAGDNVPGIVLLHGGGGTAFESWVKSWVDRGYAAIAIDSFGTLPEPKDANPRPRNPHGGPPGGSAAFSQLSEPLRDQWPFHAVAAALRATSLLCAEPGVDKDRIGLTGISWGGYLSCVVAGLDPRLKFVIPVYGCGHYEDTTFGGEISKLPPEQSSLWFAQWDAKNFIHSIRVPALWVNGTNDNFFWLPAWQKSFREMSAKLRKTTLRVAMKHGHPPAGDPPEVRAFADSIVLKAKGLPSITSIICKNRMAFIEFKSVTALSKAELSFTKDNDLPWPQKKWITMPARLEAQTAFAELPEEACFYFFTLWDERGIPISSEYESVSK